MVNEKLNYYSREKFPNRNDNGMEMNLKHLSANRSSVWGIESSEIILNQCNGYDNLPA